MCSSVPKFNEIRFCVGVKPLKRTCRDYIDFGCELDVKYLENGLT